MLIDRQFMMRLGLRRRIPKGCLAGGVEGHRISPRLASELVEAEGDHFFAVLKMSPTFRHSRTTAGGDFVRCFLTFWSALHNPLVGCRSICFDGLDQNHGICWIAE